MWRTIICILFLSAAVFSQTTKKDDRWMGIDLYSKYKVMVGIFLDTKSLVRNGDSIQFWIKEIPIGEITAEYFKASGIEVRKAQFKERLSLFTGNCRSRSLALRQTADYWKDGKSFPTNHSGDMDVVVPESYGETFLTEACAVQKK